MADQFVQRSLACMVEKVSDYAIFLLDPQGNILTWNPAATVMKGYAADEAIGCNFEMLYTDESRARGCPAANLATAAKQGTYQEEAWRRRKNGEWFWALVEIIAITDDAGALSGFCKLTRDLSNRLRMEQALRDADRRKDEFLAMLAHELRNPLAPVSAAAELLTIGKMDALAAKKAGQVILRQVKHMTEMVNDLLDASRVSRGEIVLDRIPLDLKQVVTSAVEQTRPLIENRHHTLTVTLAPDPARVYGDEKRLIQVLANLLSNAAKYTAPGGILSLVLSVRDTGVSIEVTDNGIGLDPGEQDQIFKLFGQVQRSSERASGGLGIGLSLVRSITQLHGGSVECHSAGLGQGSCFTVKLPLMTADQPVPERRKSERPDALPQPGSGLRVLVFDDDVDAGDMLEFFLTTAGHSIQVTHTVESAMEALRGDVPDVCIVDMGLPESPGKDLVSHIRSRLSPPPMVIELASYGVSGDVDQTDGEEFDFLFVKPVNLDALTRAVSTGLHR